VRLYHIICHIRFNTPSWQQQDLVLLIICSSAHALIVYRSAQSSLILRGSRRWRCFEAADALPNLREWTADGAVGGQSIRRLHVAGRTGNIAGRGHARPVSYQPAPPPRTLYIYINCTAPG